MKRFRNEILKDLEGNFIAAIIEVDDPSGPNVKYEPWMDEREWFLEEKKNIVALNDAYNEIKKRTEILEQQGIDQARGLNLGEPSICANCKNCVLEMGDYCSKGRIDYVHGGYAKVYCEKKNTGNCPDFESKEL